MTKKKNNNPKKKQTRRNWAFWLTEIASVVMFITGFFVPPMGVVDGSVLTGMGILLGFGGVSMLPDVIAAGHSATVSLPGGASVSVDSKAKNNQSSADN